MSVLIADIASDVAFALIAPVITRQAYGYATAAGAVTQAFSWARLAYVGAKIILGLGVASQEIVTVTAVDIPGGNLVSFVCANPHIAGDVVFAPTFPEGQTTDPLFTQDEILGYIADIQHEFLLKAQPVWKTTPEALVPGQRLYGNPADCIQLARISVSGMEVLETSQRNLDLDQYGWKADTSPATPQDWYQDDIATAFHGYHPTPQAGTGNPAGLWYAQGVTNPLALTDTALLPDVFTHWLKYGALGRCWAKDGEMRDPMRADYADRRVKYGIVLASKFLTADADIRLGDPRLQLRAGAFSRFPVPQEGGQ